MSEKLPARTEVTVLGPDKPRAKPIGLVVRERNGTRVFKQSAPGVPLRDLGDIRHGDKLLVTTLTGILEMTAQRGEDGILRAWSTGFVANLEFSKDDRKCWVSTYAVKRRGV